MPRANNGPYLERNTRGIWEIRWTEGGRSKCRSTRTADNGFAQKVLANFILMTDDEARVAQPDAVLLVRDVIGDPETAGPDYWTEHVIPNVIDQASAGYSRTKLLKHFGHLAVRDIMPSHVSRYVEARKAGRIGRPSVGHTIARELSVLNAAINHAVKARRLSRADQPFIKLPAASPPRDRWLTHKEADALLDAARGDAKNLPRVYRFVALALGTASRKGALLHIQRQQIDMDKGIVYLNPAGRAQTNKRRAVVPISDDLRPILAQMLNQIPDEPGAYLLDHPGSIRTSFATAIVKAKLGKDVTPHTLRHTWATWAAQAGTPMFDIAGVLGDSLATVIKTYAHHSPDHLRAAVNSVRSDKAGQRRVA